MSWEEKAACRVPEADTAHFTVDPGRANHIPAEVLAAAFRWCAPCPVRRECGEAADSRQDVGLWAGSYRTKNGHDKTAYRVVPLLPDTGRAAA